MDVGHLRGGDQLRNVPPNSDRVEEEQAREPGLDVATEVAMLFLYLPMIIFGAMFETKADKRVGELALQRAKALPGACESRTRRNEIS
jgi:hypothetical protein